MVNRRKLVIDEKELPLIVELIGSTGETRKYLMRPAGRKFGASLSKLEEPSIAQA